MFDLHTFILGVVQGLCEFLPVSSSGHLALLQNFFGFGQENILAFDLVLHCATMLVALLFFRRDIVRLLTEWFSGWFSREGRETDGWVEGWLILLAVILTAVLGLPLKSLVERAMGSTFMVGCGFLVSAALLALVPLFRGRDRIHLAAALIIGIMQGLAVFPGLSRSGSTIAVGLFMGLAVGEAFRFSFLISIPAVFGATLLEGLEIYKSGAELALPVGWVWAVVAAFILGLAALGLLRRLVLSGRWIYFSLYCLLLGSVSILITLNIL